MRYLKQNQDSYVTVGPFLDKTDGITIEDGFTVTNISYLWVTETQDSSDAHATGTCDGTAANDWGMAAVGHGGMYTLKIPDATINYVGSGMLELWDADECLPVWHEFMIVPANVWDSMMGTDLLDVSTVQWTGTAVHAATVNGVPVVQLHDSAGAGGINAPANFEDLSITDTTGIAKANAVQISDDGTAADNAELMFDGTGYAGGTIKLGVNVVSQDNIDFGALQKASINTEVDTALNTAIPGSSVADSINERVATMDGHLTADYGSDEKTAIDLLDDVDGGLGDIHTVVNTISGYGAPPAASSIADAVWDEASTGHVDAGKAGAQLWTDVDAILEDTGTTLDTLVKDIPTTTEFELRTIPAADYVVVGDTLARVTLVDTCTTNTDMRGTNSAALASVCTETRLAELDAANVPTDIANVKTDTAAILLDTGTDGVIVKAAGLDADAVDKIMDEVVDGSVTLRQAMKVFLSVLAGKTAGGGTVELTFRDVGDTKNRITATVDSNKNRTAMVLDVT